MSEIDLPMTVIEAQERANIDMLVATSKKYPRDLVVVTEKMITMATRDQETAESMAYHLNRDGHAIDGPSVRLAEIAVSCYQNIRFGARVISNDGKVIVGQGFCHDTENNTFGAWEVQRRITDKKGNTYSEDMQVTTGNAAAAIAFRNAVFKVIPSALVNQVEAAARKFAVGQFKTLPERRTRALRRFAAIGVREEQILVFLERANLDDVTADDVDHLFGLFTAIKEGSTTIEEAFPKPKVVAPNIAQKEEKPVPPPATPPVQPVDPGFGLAPVGPPPPPAPKPAEPPPPPPASEPSLPAVEKLPTSIGDVGQVAAKLKTDKISLRRFLLVMKDFGMLKNKSLDEIEAGAVTLTDVDPKYLHAALSDWRTVCDNLPAELS